jgi:hypothetical protein
MDVMMEEWAWKGGREITCILLTVDTFQDKCSLNAGGPSLCLECKLGSVSDGRELKEIPCKDQLEATKGNPPLFSEALGHMAELVIDAPVQHSGCGRPTCGS